MKMELKEIKKVVQQSMPMDCDVTVMGVHRPDPFHEYDKNEGILEIRYTTPKGEDAYEDIFFAYDGTSEGFAHALYEYDQIYYDKALEDAQGFVGVVGAPDLFELVEDAKWKIEQIHEGTKEVFKTLLELEREKTEKVD